MDAVAKPLHLFVPLIQPGPVVFDQQFSEDERLQRAKMMVPEQLVAMEVIHVASIQDYHLASVFLPPPGTGGLQRSKLFLCQRRRKPVRSAVSRKALRVPLLLLPNSQYPTRGEGCIIAILVERLSLPDSNRGSLMNQSFLMN